VATIECWGSLADVIKRLNLKKGNRLYVEGKLVPDKETGAPRAWIVAEVRKPVWPSPLSLSGQILSLHWIPSEKS